MLDSVALHGNTKVRGPGVEARTLSFLEAVS